MPKRVDRSLSDHYPAQPCHFSRSRDEYRSRERYLSRDEYRSRDRYSRSRSYSNTRHSGYRDSGYRDRKRRRRSRHRGYHSGKDRSDSASSKRRHRDRRVSRDSNPASNRSPIIQNTEEGHLIYCKEDVLNNRYVIRKELGEGTFGKVVLCKDKQQANKSVAVKIIRNVPKYRDAAKIEIEILNKILKNDQLQGCVEMLDWFNYYGHVCIVFEILGKSVFDFLKDNGFTSFPLYHIQRVAEDLCYSLQFLHSMKYTHTDLKPENILFIDSDYDTVYDEHRGMSVRYVLDPAIKVIDFGSATHEKEHHSRIVSTRHYRAPEVVCELGWSYPCDMWSVGCILFELYTGHTLFQTHDNREHLAMMEYMLGPLPSWICKNSNKKYFKKDRLDFNKHGSSGRYIRKYCKRLDQYCKDGKDPPHSSFFKLLWEMLEYDPEKRITATEALKHPFFDRSLSDRDKRSYKSR